MDGHDLMKKSFQVLCVTDTPDTGIGGLVCLLAGVDTDTLWGLSAQEVGWMEEKDLTYC